MCSFRNRWIHRKRIFWKPSNQGIYDIEFIFMASVRSWISVKISYAQQSFECTIFSVWLKNILILFPSMNLNRKNLQHVLATEWIKNNKKNVQSNVFFRIKCCWFDSVRHSLHNSIGYIWFPCIFLTNVDVCDGWFFNSFYSPLFPSLLILIQQPTELAAHCYTFKTMSNNR